MQYLNTYVCHRFGPKDCPVKRQRRHDSDLIVIWFIWRQVIYLQSLIWLHPSWVTTRFGISYLFLILLLLRKSKVGIRFYTPRRDCTCGFVALPLFIEFRVSLCVMVQAIFVWSSKNRNREFFNNSKTSTVLYIRPCRLYNAVILNYFKRYHS